jgi:hypothetical protein
MLIKPVSTLANCTATKNAGVHLSHCTEVKLHAYLHLINIGPKYILLNCKFHVGMRPTLYALISRTMYRLWNLKK